MDGDDRAVATLAQVAEAAGVSRATVSRVVNGTRNVDPALVELVERAVAETGYVPNRAARSLRTRRIGTVALVVSTADTSAHQPVLARAFTDPYLGRIVGSALLALQSSGVRLEVLLVEDPGGREAITRRLLHHDLDGVLVVSMHTQDPLPDLVARTGRPGVLLGGTSGGVPLSGVAVDDRAGGALAAGRLLARGCRRVGVLAGPETAPGSLERLRGFRETTTARGLADVPVVGGDFTVTGGELGMRTLLRLHPELDGVFAANDLMAQGATYTVLRAGSRVPEDVAVIGFDDNDIARDARPPLTTVRQPLEDMAAEAVRLLLHQLEHGPAAPGARVFPPSLVVRASA